MRTLLILLIPLTLTACGRPDTPGVVHCQDIPNRDYFCNNPDLTEAEREMLFHIGRIKHGY